MSDNKTTEQAPGSAPQDAAATPTPAATSAPASADPSAFAPPGAQATQAATAPASQPTIDTSEYDSVSSYEPQIKKGRHSVLAEVLEMAPGKSQETGEYYGWRLTLALREELPDEFGGKIPAGTRLPQMSVYTTQGQYDKNAEEPRTRAKNVLIGLNNIPQDTRSKASCDKAGLAFKALPPEKRLPLPADENQAHFDQWKGTIVRAVIGVKDGDEGVRVRLYEILAKDTIVKAAAK